MRADFAFTSRILLSETLPHSRTGAGESTSVSPFYGFGFGEEAGVAALAGLAAFAGVAVAVALFGAELDGRGAFLNASTILAVKSTSSRE